MTPEVIKFRSGLKSKGMTDVEMQPMVAAFMKSPACNPAMKLRNRMDKVCDGSISAVDWPWAQISMLAPVLIPGSVSVFMGPPGASKSFVVMQCLNYWAICGITMCVLALEGTQESHMHRLLAQLDMNSELTDLKWCKKNPDLVNQSMNLHYANINNLGRSIHVSPLGSMNYLDVLNWVEDQACAGNRLIVVDPITAADPGRPPWEADRMLMCQLKAYAEQYKLSIILISHSTKGYLQPSLDCISGGAAVQRFIDGAIWLQAIESSMRTVKGCCGTTELQVNRIMHLLKVRDGIGTGYRVGCYFDGGSLSLSECGILVKEKKGIQEDD